MADLTAQQKDVLVRTVLGEAANQGATGMAAVASVIKNRATSGQFGSSDPATIALQRNQFSANNPLTNGGNNVGRNASVASTAYQRALAAVEGVFNGTIADPTNGATYYHTAAVNPGWDNNMYQTASIGAHTFYSPSPVPPANVPNAAPAAGPDTSAIGYAEPSFVPPSSAQDAITQEAGAPVPLAFDRPRGQALIDNTFSALGAGAGANQMDAGTSLAFNPAMGPTGTQTPTFDAGTGFNPATGTLQPFDTPFNQSAYAPSFAPSMTPAQAQSFYASLGIPAAAPRQASVAAQDSSPLASILGASNPGSIYNSLYGQGNSSPMPFNTGQGIAGTAQLPAGVVPAGASAMAAQAQAAMNGMQNSHPQQTGDVAQQLAQQQSNGASWANLQNSFVPQSSGNGNSGSSTNSDSWNSLMNSFSQPTQGPSPSQSNNDSWSNLQNSFASAPSGSSSMAMNDPGYNAQPKTITQTVANPAYSQWVSLSSSADSDPYQNAAFNYAMSQQPAPPKYITQTVANPNYVAPSAVPAASAYTTPPLGYSAGFGATDPNAFSTQLGNWFGGTPLGHISSFLQGQAPVSGGGLLGMLTGAGQGQPASGGLGGLLTSVLHAPAPSVSIIGAPVGATNGYNYAPNSAGGYTNVGQQNPNISPSQVYAAAAQPALASQPNGGYQAAGTSGVNYNAHNVSNSSLTG